MFRYLLIAVLLVAFAPARGDEPEKKKANDKPAPKNVEKKAEEKPDEAAPAPRAVPGELVIPNYYYQRINRWDRWQNVAVAHSNQWRPRVIYSPNGAYYLYNGKPYPWMPVAQTNIQAMEVGTPYRAAPERMPYCDD